MQYLDSPANDKQKQSHLVAMLRMVCPEKSLNWAEKTVIYMAYCKFLLHGNKATKFCVMIWRMA